MYRHYQYFDTDLCHHDDPENPRDPEMLRRWRGRQMGGRPGWGGRARRGQMRSSILRLLAEQDMNGYQLMSAVAEKTMDTWHPSPGAIYPSLNRLEAEGLIAATQSDGQKVYTLTDAGRAALDQVPDEPWADVGQTPSQHSTMMEQFRNLGITVRFAGQTATDEQLTAIATQLESTRKTILAILAESA